MSLPGEIRNTIYELVLSEQPVQCLRAYACWWFRNYQEYGSKWEEHALLTVSKQIRLEACSIHFQSNRFVLAINTDEIPDACWWLQSVSQICGPRPFGSVHFYIKNSRSTDVRFFLPLAQQFHETFSELSDQPEVDTPADCRAHGWVFLSIFWTFQGQRFIFEALEEVKAMGIKASREDWHSQWLEVEFGLWAEGRLNSTLVKGRARDAKKKKEWLERCRKL